MSTFRTSLIAAALSLVLASCVIYPVDQEAASPPPAQTAPGRVVAPTTPPPGTVVPATPAAVPAFRLNEVHEYVCDGGRLLVRYTSNESAQIFDAGQWHTLTRTVNMDGYFVYRDSHYSWYARSNVGYLTLNGNMHARDCRI